MKLKTILVVMGILLPTLSLTQKVTGVVRSSSGNILPHTTLHLKKSNTWTETDANGQFTMVLHSSDSIIFSHTGYKSKSLFLVAKDTFIHVQLNPSSDLEEVVVSTGYQQIPKERATGSFVFVDSALLNKRVGPDIISRLEGNVPGLLFNRNVSSTLNNTGGYNLSIRGRSTLFANDQPLVVVDGFPYDGDISNINPNDIASVTVLKDAAASSIWGVKSGNGVIVLTTKKRKQNQKVSVELNANTTIGNRPNLFYSPNWINASDFIDIEKSLFEQGYYDNDLTSSYHPVVSPVVALLDEAKRGLISSPDANTQIDALRSNDFRKDVRKYLYRNSIAQQYSLSFRGGGPVNDYFLSMGFDNNQSNQVGNKNYRLTLTANNNFHLFKEFTLSLGYNYIQSKAAMNSPLPNLYPTASKPSYYPYARLVDQNGQSVSLVKNYAESYTDTAGGGQLLNWKYNPLEELKNADNTSSAIDNRFNLGIKYIFLHTITFDLKYQYERLSTNSENYYSPTSYYARNLTNQYTDFGASNPLGLVHPIPIGGIGDKSNALLNAHHGRSQLTYANHWNQQSINAIIGAEINQNITETSNSRVYGYDKSLGSVSSVDLISNYRITPSGSAMTIPNGGVGFGKITNRYISYFSNATYTFQDRYILSGSGRIDKSNLFGVKTNQKAVPLYSLGAAWIVSEEPFYKLDWLPYSKIRFSYGYNANLNSSLTAMTVTTYLGNNSFYSNLPYAIISNPGNPQLKWERIRMMNMGWDFSLKEERIKGSFDIYYKKGLDLIGQAPLAPSTGLTTQYGNFSDTKGHGFDLTLSTTNINKRKFIWTTTFMLSQAKDQVTKYDVATTSSNYIMYGDGAGGSVYPLVGFPLFSLYSYRWGGLDKVGDPQGYIHGQLSKDYSDILNNTSSDSMVYHGASRPTIFGSLRNTFSYGQMSLSINILYKLGYYFRRSSISYSSLFANWTVNKDYYNRWQKSGDESHTDVPALQYPPIDNGRDLFYTYSSALVEKGDHIRLQDINLSYLVTKDKWKKMPFYSISLYGYINNVMILWRANKQHLDPDIYGNSGYPIPKTYSFGLKANF